MAGRWTPLLLLPPYPSSEENLHDPFCSAFLTSDSNSGVDACDGWLPGHTPACTQLAKEAGEVSSPRFQLPQWDLWLLFCKAVGILQLRRTLGNPKQFKCPSHVGYQQVGSEHLCSASCKLAPYTPAGTLLALKGPGWDMGEDALPQPQ